MNPTPSNYSEKMIRCVECNYIKSYIDFSKKQRKLADVNDDDGVWEAICVSCNREEHNTGKADGRLKGRG